MSSYTFATRPLTDGLVGLVLPRAHAERHHGDAVSLAMPFRATVSPYDAPKSTDSSQTSRGSVHDKYRAGGDASDALLSLTSIDRPTQLRPGGKNSLMMRMNLEEMRPSMEKLKETHKRKRVNANKVRRREQCRANQARYRDRQRNAQVQLEQNVDQLHQEVDKLKRRYRDLSSRERSNQSPWSIVAEVFRLLESSFQSPWRVANVQELKSHMATQQTLAILESAFAHDAAMGDLRGVDALMEQLRLYSEWFGNPKLHLQRVEAVAPGVMAATATLNVTVTELTLRHVFPHLVESAGENNCEQLCQRLLGQRLDCSSAVTFLFDEDSDRIVRLEASIDMMTPLLRMLGSIEDASEVLKHSRITAECTISCAPDQ